MSTEPNRQPAPAPTAAEYVAAMRAAGLTYPAIAEAVGVSERTVHRWSRGETEPEVRAVRDQLARVAHPYMQSQEVDHG